MGNTLSSFNGRLRGRLRGQLYSLLYVLSRYRLENLSSRGVPRANNSEQEQSAYLKLLLVPLSVLIAGTIAAIAVPSVDVRQFSPPVAFFMLSLGLALPGFFLDFYLVMTAASRGNRLTAVQLKSNDTLPITLPVILLTCSALSLIAGVIAMIIHPYDSITSDEASRNWAGRLIVVLCSSVAVLLSAGVVACSEVFARTSAIQGEEPHALTNRPSASPTGCVQQRDALGSNETPTTSSQPPHGAGTAFAGTPHHPAGPEPTAPWSRVPGEPRPAIAVPSTLTVSSLTPHPSVGKHTGARMLKELGHGDTSKCDLELTVYDRDARERYPMTCP